MLPFPRILVVDDDSITSELVEFMLHNSATDCEVVSVLTPNEGLRRAAAERFDLYVLDYRLAAMTGPEVCRALRRMDADTPIMFFTGEAQEVERETAMLAGADAYLVKPRDVNKLTETVNRLLNKRKAASVQNATETL